MMLKIEWKFRGQSKPDGFFPKQSALTRAYTPDGSILEFFAEDGKLVFAITLSELEYISVYEFEEGDDE